MAYVTLDGADTALINFVHGIDLGDIDAAAARAAAPAPVRVRYVPSRGRITDSAFVLA